jgi:hypothetical protein
MKSVFLIYATNKGAQTPRDIIKNNESEISGVG